MGRQKHDRKTIKRAQADARRAAAQTAETPEGHARRLVEAGLATGLILDGWHQTPHGGRAE